MNDDNRRAPGSQDGRGDSTRVGTSERDAAIALLAEHWHAGRLDPGEHELRVTRARAAVTRADLDSLFTDLPAPGSGPAATGDVTVRGAGGVTVEGAGGFLQRKRDTAMALVPFAALVLFFVTGSWLWFLMVPVLGILLYGPGGKKGSRQRGRGEPDRGSHQ